MGSAIGAGKVGLGDEDWCGWMSVTAGYDVVDGAEQHMPVEAVSELRFVNEAVDGGVRDWLGERLIVAWAMFCSEGAMFVKGLLFDNAHGGEPTVGNFDGSRDGQR